MTDQFPATRANSPFKQTMLGGYDRLEVDEYVARLERRIEELEQQRSPDGAVQRALDQVGGEVSGILQRAHETASQLTEAAQKEAEEMRREAQELRDSVRHDYEQRMQDARREADEKIGQAHRDAASITEQAHERLRDLDVDADRVWAERERIITDLRYLAQQLFEVADAAVERVPSDDAEDGQEASSLDPAATAAFDVEGHLEQEEGEEPATDADPDADGAGDLEDTMILEPHKKAEEQEGEGPGVAGD